MAEGSFMPPRMSTVGLIEALQITARYGMRQLGRQYAGALATRTDVSNFLQIFQASVGLYITARGGDGGGSSGGGSGSGGGGSSKIRVAVEEVEEPPYLHLHLALHCTALHLIPAAAPGPRRHRVEAQGRSSGGQLCAPHDHMHAGAATAVARYTPHIPHHVPHPIPHTPYPTFHPFLIWYPKSCD
mmetsp:Transcript_12007/g.26952  ORF Transcript_12007/g.26952 Transcript_12007/m.26952 type:complete len:186 (-) Transcript_12007:394-951(-)